MQAVEGACVADYKKLCSDVEPGEGRSQACLKANHSELSSGCKENLEKFAEAFVKACKQDVQNLCANVDPGEGRILACLKQTQESVSAGCIGFLTQ